jgi:hypothetical protein
VSDAPVLTLTFDNGAQARVEGWFFFRDASGAYDDFGDFPEQLPRFAALKGRRVTYAAAREDGGLLIRFGQRTQLIVLPNVEHGAWDVMAADGSGIACGAGGELAVWAPARALRTSGAALQWEVEVYQPHETKEDYKMPLGTATAAEMKGLVGWAGDADAVGGAALTRVATERLATRFGVRFHPSKLDYVIVERSTGQALDRAPPAGFSEQAKPNAEG